MAYQERPICQELKWLMMDTMATICPFIIFLGIPVSACEPGWSAFQGSCYKLTSYPLELNGSVLESRWGCLNLGADLATIRTDEEQTFIENMLQAEVNGTPVVSKAVYIAAGDGPSEGVFRWFDGSLVGTGKKWRSPNPNNGGTTGIEENCVRVNSGYVVKFQSFRTNVIGTWIDVPCLQPKIGIDSFFCQKPDKALESSPRQHKFRMMKGHYFDGHHVAQYTVTSSTTCLGMCLALYSCLSVNYRLTDDITDNCVLNNATWWEDRHVMLTNATADVDPGQWVHYEVLYPAFHP